jgi:sugar/nucleoside kinase (ribokinase family)
VPGTILLSESDQDIYIIKNASCLYAILWIMKSPNILLVGHVCIDHNKSEHSSYESWGSSVIYMATSFQKQFNATPRILTSYGPDLSAFLPDVTLLPAIPTQPDTLIYENDSTSGRRIQHCHNLESATPPELTAEAIEAVESADIIVVATLLPNYPATYLKTLLESAKPGTLKVLCPQGYFRSISEEGLVQPRDFEEAPQIVPLFDLVMYSEEDYPRAFELAKTWKRTMPTEIIVTQSADGATIVSESGEQHIPTTPIAQEDIIDSVGCGDTFAAAVTYNYYLSNDLPSAILEGHAAAAKKLLTTPTS